FSYLHRSDRSKLRLRVWMTLEAYKMHIAVQNTTTRTNQNALQSGQGNPHADKQRRSPMPGV
ncbi:MAG: hypothetical protein CYG59_11510, partial [Chloroflexi bacterium]